MSGLTMAHRVPPQQIQLRVGQLRRPGGTTDSKQAGEKQAPFRRWPHDLLPKSLLKKRPGVGEDIGIRAAEL
jgi:hypothetical protein